MVAMGVWVVFLIGRHLTFVERLVLVACNTRYVGYVKRWLRVGCTAVLGTPWIFRHAAFVPLHVAHLDERIGLFMLIVSSRAARVAALTRRLVV